MSTFVVIFLGLVAVVLVLVPLVIQLFRETADLRLYAQAARLDVLTMLKDADFNRLASEHASDGLLIQDLRGRIIWTNPAFCRIHGRTQDEVLGRHPQEFALPPDQIPPPEDIAAFRYDPKDPSLFKLQLFENQHKDGHLFWNQINVTFKRFADGREYAILVCRDVTEQVNQENRLRDAQKRLEIEATHDGLTGVPNRAAFLSFINNALKDASERPVGLLHVDLDKFKSINDTHGHSAGDAILLHAANALRDHIRLGDLVARVGGDEFVVVCPDMASLDALDALACDLAAAISVPFEWSSRNLSCEASIGAALSNDSTMNTEQLLIQSDFALYEAKREGRNQVAVYDEDLHARHAQHTLRSAELSTVIDIGDLDYHFQPLMCLNSGRIKGLETLVRWIHPEDGLIPPDDFLPMAKDLGMMGTLDLWSMTAAIQQKIKLNASGFDDVEIAFNASPELLSHPEFVTRLIWGVEAGGIDRAHVSIEVLETTQFGDASETSSHAAIISDLRAAGFQVQLDDFGKGFAGLTHLAQLDVTGVKIDRSLITNIMADDVSQKIVRKTIELSNDLGLTVVAEGVEDHKTSAALAAMGCDAIQGYWLSHPMPADDLHDWLTERGNKPKPQRA